jgi:hypothetical protein
MSLDLARATGALHRLLEPNLEAALRQLCETLLAQAEPRSILISLQVGRAMPDPSFGRSRL